MWLLSCWFTFCLQCACTSAASISKEDRLVNNEAVRHILKDFNSLLNTSTGAPGETESVTGSILLQDLLNIMKNLSESQAESWRGAATQPKLKSHPQQAFMYENVNGNSTIDSNDFPIPRGSLVYGSPICIYQCIIVQVYWADSSISILGVQLPQIPSIPTPSPA